MQRPLFGAVCLDEGWKRMAWWGYPAGWWAGKEREGAIAMVVSPLHRQLSLSRLRLQGVTVCEVRSWRDLEAEPRGTELSLGDEVDRARGISGRWRGERVGGDVAVSASRHCTKALSVQGGNQKGHVVQSYAVVCSPEGIGACYLIKDGIACI